MKKPEQRLFIRSEFLLLLLFCLLIAVFLNFIREDGIVKNLIFSEAIGISIYTTIKLLLWKRKCDKTDFLSQLIGIPVGGTIGVIIGMLLTKTHLSNLLDFQQNELVVLTGSAIVFGTAISYFFYSQERLNEQQSQLQAQARKRIEYEKNLMESQLRLLQAQIEPHFLFNSLANITSLIDSDPQSAKIVTEQLSQFLRTSLQRTRNEHSTVKDEVTLLNAYLSIQQVRMTERLQFKIDCPDSLLKLPLPALLVQPLVENAVKHGLENTVEGGSISISFQQKDQQLSVIVKDSGTGIQQGLPQGMGLKNIRERLQALYGKTASLTLTENISTEAEAQTQIQNKGVSAELKLPITIPASLNRFEDARS